jgi:anti-anti-sigma factor
VVTQAEARTSVPLVEVDITGRLDVTCLPAVRAVLHPAVRLRPDLLVIDLAGCSGIDAAAIALLLDVHRDLLRAGSSLTLRAPTPQLRRILAIARVAHVLHIVPGVAPPGTDGAVRGSTIDPEAPAVTPQSAVAGKERA